jgi:hypothetical protein
MVFLLKVIVYFFASAGAARIPANSNPARKWFSM